MLRTLPTYSYVPLQVLQTLYMLIQNVRIQTAIYYILSNNHVNDIVTLSFDFEDDEVLGYYINLLKSISLRLTPKSVQFFYQVTIFRTTSCLKCWLPGLFFYRKSILSSSTLFWPAQGNCGIVNPRMQQHIQIAYCFQEEGEQSSFPLYTEAIKFINHRDAMVRAAVRTLTLNVYGIDDEAVQGFLISQPASNYFNELAIVIAEQCQVRIMALLCLLLSRSLSGQQAKYCHKESPCVDDHPKCKNS